MRRRGIISRALVFGALVLGVLLLLVWAIQRTAGEPSADSSAIDDLLVPALVGGAVLVALLLWMRTSITRPLRVLKEVLPVLSEEPSPALLKLRGPEEMESLARDIHQVGLGFALATRTSLVKSLSIQDSFERLHAVLQSLGEGVVVCDGSGTFVLANPVAASLLDVPLAGVSGTSLIEALPPEERARVRTAISHALRADENAVVKDVKIAGRVLNLSVTPVRASVINECSADAAEHVAIVFIDLTHVHEINRLKDDFLSSVSHELRTPLTSIRSFTEILLHMTPGDEKTWKEFLEIVNQEAKRLTRLVNDVLDLARIEAGRMDFAIEPVRIEEVAKATVAVFRPILRSKMAQVTVRSDPNLLPVAADPDRLNQVLTNLVGNSCKFLPQGGIVQISAEMKGSDVLVQVEDSGDGVPGEQRELVFNKFRQGNSDGLTEKPQGTGLGLAICREIVEHMGGRIWCRESDLGGALFAFTLPVSETVVG